MTSPSLLQHELMSARVAAGRGRGHAAGRPPEPHVRPGAPPGRVGPRAVAATALVAVARRLDADRAWRAML